MADREGAALMSNGDRAGAHHTAIASSYTGRASAGADCDIDPRRFRDLLGRFATGVVAVTGYDPATGRPAGLAANSFTSVSLDPPLVGFCVAHTSSSWPLLRRSPGLAVSILGADQEHVCRRLAAKGGDKFAGLETGWSPLGTPIVAGALAWLDCRVEAEHSAGDHAIVVARVRRLTPGDATGADPAPLVFYRGTYGGFLPPA
ncbi:flavin reductase family protein [Nocardiopsis mangrovi]|uniref:Flavin reductase family protein n=1 Tax=Nocardiopsis mangrovi TaxID=1179818 RepID=A0ABV9E0T6_9ACTN